MRKCRPNGSWRISFATPADPSRRFCPPRRLALSFRPRPDQWLPLWSDVSNSISLEWKFHDRRQWLASGHYPQNEHGWPTFVFLELNFAFSHIVAIAFGLLQLLGLLETLDRILVRGLRYVAEQGVRDLSLHPAANAKNEFGENEFGETWNRSQNFTMQMFSSLP